MGLTKSEIFSQEQNALAMMFKVFGHPARVAIIQHIFNIQGCVCGDLVSEIGLAQPTISQHLKELKLLGIIKGNVEGTKVCYCINENKWAEIKGLMTEFLDLNNSPSKNCC